MISQLRDSVFALSVLLLLASPDLAQADSYCTLNGVRIPNGGSITEYQQSSVAFGQSCVGEVRVCKGGRLSGSYTNSSCKVQPAANCSFNGQTVLHGSGVWAFSISSVPYSGPMNGMFCQQYQQYRSCYNGVLSGNAQYASCTVDAPRACTFDGQTYAHGSSITGYAQATVNYAAGQYCMGENMSCSDGSWTYNYNMGGFTPTSSTCTASVPVIATASPASQYKCTVRTIYSPTTIYDAMFALQPDNDVDCYNAANFYILRSGQSSIPRQAIWNYSSVIYDYTYSATPALSEAKCAYKVGASADAVISSDMMNNYSCRDFCVSASLANPSASVMCYYAHTPVEGFVNGTGSVGDAYYWIPQTYTYVDESGNGAPVGVYDTGGGGG